MPAWSPGGLQPDFVRTTGGRRVLPVYDPTPGLQAILNPPIDLGADAPTPQTRAFQSSWGGLSIAESSALDVPVVTCTTTCLQSLQTSLTKVVLNPTVSTTTKTQTIGIFVVRVTGKRKLLGRTVPRIRQIGRVPLARRARAATRSAGTARSTAAAQARDLPAHVPGAPAHAHREHLRLRPLHRSPSGAGSAGCAGGSGSPRGSR